MYHLDEGPRSPNRLQAHMDACDHPEVINLLVVITAVLMCRFQFVFNPEGICLSVQRVKIYVAATD